MSPTLNKNMLQYLRTATKNVNTWYHDPRTTLPVNSWVLQELLDIVDAALMDKKTELEKYKELFNGDS